MEFRIDFVDDKAEVFRVFDEVNFVDVNYKQFAKIIV